MIKNTLFLRLFSTFFLIIFLGSCGPFKPSPSDARKVSPNVDERVRQNIEQGKGFRLMGGNKQKGGTFDFASSNELWRASLDTIDFMPLLSANYSGGIIITDWYSDGKNAGESIKISIRFLTNEIRSDALDVKVFIKKCKSLENCLVTETKGVLVSELKKKILYQASIYKKENDKKNFKPYDNTSKPDRNKKKKIN
jgi:hypothetical protein|tara:strand:- start:1338 stop:1925 length:588 start_codon:yes stop_codon:yes gene_type:complete